MANREENWKQAVAVFGFEGDAEAWMSRPAIGLAYRKSKDVLDTPEGCLEVSELRTRLDHGVHI